MDSTEQTNNGFLQGSLNFWKTFSENAPALFETIYSQVIPTVDASLINFLADSKSFKKIKADFAPKTEENSDEVSYQLRLIYFVPDFKDVKEDIEDEDISQDKEILRNTLSSSNFFKVIDISFDLQQGLIIINTVL